MQGKASDRELIQAGVVLGLGFGGFFDGIVFHQILQWHHMLTSAGYPPTSLSNLQVDTFADGLFHAGTYLLSLLGIYLLWKAMHEQNQVRDGKPGGFATVAASMLAGWGIFNLIEGLLNHFILGIHHVRDDIPVGASQMLWDLGFQAWGAAMLLVGWLWLRWLSRRKDHRQVDRFGMREMR